MKMRIPVLMYHALDNSENPCGSDDPSELVYVVNTAEFRRQMEFLRNNGFTTITSMDLLSGKVLPKKAVIIGFDDGHVSNYSLALPILKEFGFTTEVYVTTDWIDTPHYLTSDNIIALQREGIVIGSHGATHRFLSDLLYDDMKGELSKSKEVLETILNQPLHVFAAPGGRYNRDTIKCLKQLAYSVAYTSKIGYLEQGTDLFEIPRFAIKRNTAIGEFEKIVNRDLGYFYKKVAVAGVLRFAKSILGNTLYTLVRGKFLRQS